MVIFFVMMVPFVNGWTSLVESSALGAVAAFMAAVLKGRMTRNVFENSVRQTLGVSCMFMWIILAALGFGAIFDGLGAVRAIEGLFTETLNLSPWMILILMQLSFIIMGTFLDDTAMLVIVEIAATFSPRNRARIASGTVDMPTASAPKMRIARISAGVSKDGPEYQA